MSITAMKQAADQLEIGLAYPGMRFYHDNIRAAITALRTAIEAAEKQEPVAWRYRGNLHEFDPSDWAEGPVTPLYTTPPAAQRQWVGLTEKDFSAINQSCLTKFQAATSAESILKEKNHG